MTKRVVKWLVSCCIAQSGINKSLAPNPDTDCRNNLGTSCLLRLSTMIILPIAVIIVGALLGQRFKVFVLVPASAIGLAAAFCIGMAHGNSFRSILLGMVLAISALQMGYLGGVAMRFFGPGLQARKDSIIRAA
jgi:hypothetical protein